MTSSLHIHRESANPRKAGVCDCGRKLSKHKVFRNPEFERELTQQAAPGLDVGALHRMASRRADVGQVEYGACFPTDDRDLLREALEELADCRNYLVWALERIHRGLDDESWRVPALQLALQHVIMAFEEIRSAA